jgi:peroxiredoxin
LYGTIYAYHWLSPVEVEPLGPPWLEACRQVCAQYGLVPTGDVKADAEEFLQATGKEELSAPLAALLDTSDFARAESEPHPLLGQAAPNFELSSVAGHPVALAEVNSRGPVVLVFYYGYGCSHCVAQLFAIQQDLDYFREMGAQVIAVSADAPAETLEQYRLHGAFDFAVLSDPDYRVAEAYGVYRRETDDQTEDLQHGTFLIDRSGKIVFTNRGYQPFVDNRSLLQWIAVENAGSDLHGRHTAAAPAPGVSQ